MGTGSAESPEIGAKALDAVQSPGRSGSWTRPGPKPPRHRALRIPGSGGQIPVVRDLLQRGSRSPPACPAATACSTIDRTAVSTSFTRRADRAGAAPGPPTTAPPRAAVHEHDAAILVVTVGPVGDRRPAELTGRCWGGNGRQEPVGRGGAGPRPRRVAR